MTMGGRLRLARVSSDAAGGASDSRCATTDGHVGSRDGSIGSGDGREGARDGPHGCDAGGGRAWSGPNTSPANASDGKSTTTAAALKRRNRTLLLYSTAVIILFMGASYAAVPLYRLFCQKTGYAGTPRRGVAPPETASTTDDTVRGATRPIRVTFNADVASSLPWTFRAQQKEIEVMPGETALAFYTVRNLADRDVIGVSSYNVTPDKAGAYFNKIQCFCFEDQRLGAGEQVDLPVLFYIDRSFATDPQTRHIERLTLSYTFFPSKDPAPP